MSWLSIIYISLFISIIINIATIWYAAKMVKELMSVSATVEEMFEDIDIFVSHLKGVYELEAFYGDETLGNLLSHSVMLKEEIQKYKLSFSLIEEGEESENDERFSPSPPP